MASETYLDLTYDRKGQKRPSRPKLLKLTEVSMPHRNRKKTKLKVKERSQSNARERIYDDPAYTDDISHLALPLRRNSGPDKIEAGTFHKRKSNHKDNNNHYYTKRLDPPIYKHDGGSSSSDNLPPDPGKNKRGQSLERANIIDRSPKKREKRDRSAKQRRNLSLDNTLSSSLRRSLEKSEPSLKTASIERTTNKSKQKSSIQRQNASEGWNSCLAATSDSSKATENEETYSRRKDSKMQIGKRFLRGEIGIKSFNYYLIKEGLKSSKKFVEKQRNSLTRNDSKKLHTRSEENIYEEIFFVDKNSDDPEDHHSKYPDCELCMQECTKENCEYCFEDIRTRQQYFGSLGRNDRHPLITALGGLRAELHGSGGGSMGAGGSSNKFAHVLEFQSYNPNNPGVYKIETTPVAFTSDYNPIHQFQPPGEKHKQMSNYNHPQPPIPTTTQIPLNQQHANQIQLAAQHQQQQQQQRRQTRNVNQIIAPHLNTKSSSSSDSLHHKYARPDQTIGSLDLYEYQHPILYGSTGGIGNVNNKNNIGNLPTTQYEPQIYKSDSKVSIISEYSVRSESSNRNFRCGEVSDSSLGDSMFSYSTQQRRYFGSSESCRFAFECRRCSLDGEKCSFSDTCRYECRNCDCSSSYFSSDFDDLNYNNHHHRRRDMLGGSSQNSQRSYEYFNDSIDVKQNKYAQDFFKHVNDVKRSIYQAEIQGSSGIIDSYSTIPSQQQQQQKQIDIKKSINYDSPQSQQQRQYHRQQQMPLPTTNKFNINRSVDNDSPFKISTSHQQSKSYTTLPLMKDVNRDKKSSITKKTTSVTTTTNQLISDITTSKKNPINENSIILSGRGSENISNFGTYSGGYSSSGIGTKIDKSIKYSDGKPIYAKPITIINKQQEKENDLILDRNQGQNRKRDTGAIPKLSSSTSSSCSPHQSTSSPHQNKEQQIIIKSITGQQQQKLKSPNTSPKITRKRLPNNNQDVNEMMSKQSNSTLTTTTITNSTNSNDIKTKITNSTIKEPKINDNDNKKRNTNKIDKNHEQHQKTTENLRKEIELRKLYQNNDKINVGHYQDSIIIQKKYQQQHQQQQQQYHRRNEKINSKNESSLSQSQPELSSTIITTTASSASSGVIIKVMTDEVEQLKGKKKLKSIKNPSVSSKSTNNNNISHRGYSQEYLAIDDDNEDDDEVFYDARSEDSVDRKRDNKKKRSVPITTSSTLSTSSNNKNNNISLISASSMASTTTTTTPASAGSVINDANNVKQSKDKKNNDKIISKKCEYNKNNLKDDKIKDKQQQQQIKKPLTTMSLYSTQTTTTTTTFTSSSSIAPTTALTPSSELTTKTINTISLTTSTTINNCDNLMPQLQDNDNLQQPKVLKLKSNILMNKQQQQQQQNENSIIKNINDKKETLATSKALNNIAQQHVANQNDKDLSMKLKLNPQNVANEGEIISDESFSVNRITESEQHKQSIESKATSVDIDNNNVNNNNNDCSKISQSGELQEKKIGLSNNVVAADAGVTTAVATNDNNDHIAETTTKIIDTTTTTATTSSSFTNLTTTTATILSTVAGDITSITNNCADNEFSRLTNAANVAGVILNRDQIEHQQQQQQPKDQIYKQDTNNNKSIDITSDAATSTDESHLTTRTSDRTDSNDFSSKTDKIDISDLPLPALPPKRGRSRSKTSSITHHQQQQQQQSTPQLSIDNNKNNDYILLSTTDPRLQYAARRRESLETSTRSFNEKLEARKMHYHSMGHMGHHNLSASAQTSSSSSGSKPTYLFGESRYHQQQHLNHHSKQNNHNITSSSSGATAPITTNDEIYLNKSGWVQVNSKRINNDENFSVNHNNRKSNHLIRTENQNGFLGTNNNNSGGGGNNLKNSVRVIQIGNTGDKQQQQQQPVYAVPRITNSKIEELISRNEARRNNSSSTIINHRQYMKPGYKIIDPQIASILNERPGFLPVKTFMDLESPPPITPILSPPPAFQDTKNKYRNLDIINNSSNVRIQINPNCNGQQQQKQQQQQQLRHDPSKTNKGMVFSRSFEYDRKPTDHYAETFSKSFDCNLSDKPSSSIIPIVPQKRDRSPNFGNLTGCSPNYLTKKETTTSSSGNRSRESSPKYQIQGGYLNITNNQTKEIPVYSNPRKLDKSKSTTTSNSFDRNGRSRRAQFTRVTSIPNPPSLAVSRFRSFDTNISQRLNSCDSGARSDLSNDELDDDDEHSSEFLSASYQSQSSFKQNKQRSLTPERYDSQGSQNSLRKQRSLTPESRSLTPEDRRKKGSQISLSSRQNSRNNTLERKQKFEDKSLSASRSSSSSSYSGGEHLDIPTSHRRATTRNTKTPEEHRIRRSRSLQLSEKSPNRTLGHKNGQQQITSSSMNKQQQQRQSQQQHQIRNTNFPPTIRPNQIITSDPLNTIIINNRNIRSNNDIDKSRSFDFDYGPYNNHKTMTTNNVPIGGGSGGGGVNSRLDFDKSRSFDEDYREQSNKLRKYLTDNTIIGLSQSNNILKSTGSSNNNLTTIQTTGPRTSATGLERSVGGGSGSGGSSSGSGQRQTSPQNYGTRLCDHEMTYDMLRRTLDRSPIMDFSRDYDIPQSMKNRETINAGGNSELNFTSDRIYNNDINLIKQLTTNNKQQQRLLNQSPSDSSYSLDRLNSSRDSITPDSSEMKSIRDALNIAINDDRLRSEYAIYRQQRSLIDRNNGSNSNNSGGGGGGGPGAGGCNQNNSTQAASVSRGSCSTVAKSCDYYPHCGTSGSGGGGGDKQKNIKSKKLQQHQQQQLKLHQQQQHQLYCRCNNCISNNLSYTNTDLFILSDDNYDDDDEDNNDDDDDDYDSLYENVHVINKKNYIKKCGNNNNKNNRNNKNSVKKIIGVDQQQQQSLSQIISCKNCNQFSKNNIKNLKINSDLKRASSVGHNKNRNNKNSNKNNNEILLKKKSSSSLKHLNLRDNNNRIITKPPIYVNSTTLTNNTKLNLTTTTITTPPAATTTTTTIIFLGEREMPITRESKINLSPTSTIKMTPGMGHHQYCFDGDDSENENNFCSKCSLDYRDNIHGMTTCQNKGHSPTTSNDYRSIRPTKIRLKIGTSNKYYYRIYKKQQSLSLPNLFIETSQFPSANLMDNESDKCDLFSTSLINQMRSVSSPSLTDNPLENNINKNNLNNINDNNINNKSSNENYNNSPFTTTVSVNNSNQHNNYPGVLQKFKKTFSQFSNSVSNGGNMNSKQIQQQINTTSATTTINNENLDSSGKYRFGPLIWRSSKERRKTKYNRRDKCNSGDSGIQIELENEETFMQDGQDESIESTITSTGTTVHGNNSNNATTTTVPIIIGRSSSSSGGIRRTNSVKLTNSMQINCSGPTTAKAKALKKLDNDDNNFINNKLKPKRSLSQPNGLDRMTARNDLDESDTDSVSSHPDLHEAYRSIYAEVLFPFTPAGPQELQLERGSLIEILRKDIGPWWYGKIKNDAIIEKLIESQQGWFPKDFVRIIPPPYFEHHHHHHHTNNNSHDNNQQPNEEIGIKTEKINNLIKSKSISSNNIINIEQQQNTEMMTTTIIKNLTDLTKTINNKSSTSQKNNYISNNSNNVPVITSSTSTSSNTITTATAASQLKLVLHTNENLRNSVIKELLETEINYVKLLSTLCLGYLREMRKRIDIFSTESLNLIFSNIENVWQFQQIFLNSLRKGIETGHISQAFLDHQSGFLVYSNYCNSYPRALMELESYSGNKDAKIILENIRVAENLSNLPLSAHLLAPIQRICRYPLHLGELVKHSQSITSFGRLNEENDNNGGNNSSNIGDTKENLEIALNAMKKVTETVNEGKRHSEHLSRFQSSFDNFQGPPIAFHSTRFFMQTDATRVSPNLWNNTYTLFLFDRQLIYCKKDILKRNHFIYKGRIFLDNCRILNLPDGKMFGVTLKNALRIYCESLNKWFDFCFRSASRKLRFLSTLAVERQFCGTNLFVSELVGNNNDNNDDCDNLSDREYHSDYDTPSSQSQHNQNSENILNWKVNLYDCDKIPIDIIGGGGGSTKNFQKYCDTLPKKSKKNISNRNGRNNNNSSNNGSNNGGGGGGGNSSGGDNNYDNYNNTSSLGRRKIGNWFRKAKSTNSTPTQSPTHNPNNMIVFNSDSSSQSSPALDGGGTYKSTIIQQQSVTK